MSQDFKYTFFNILEKQPKNTLMTKGIIQVNFFLTVYCYFLLHYIKVLTPEVSLSSTCMLPRFPRHWTNCNIVVWLTCAFSWRIQPSWILFTSIFLFFLSGCMAGRMASRMSWWMAKCMAFWMAGWDEKTRVSTQLARPSTVIRLG